MALLSCSSISLELGGRGILEDVSLDVEQAEVVGLAGPNGAGKTSLFEVLSGRQLRHGGDVVFEGRSIATLPMKDRARMGVVRSYQRPIVPAALTVEETLKAARKAFKPFPSRLRLEWATEFVRMRAPLDAPTGSLETLERRKLMLACLLLRNPTIVLLDEPASGLTGSEIDEIDLIEVFNPRVAFDAFNEEAVRFAGKYRIPAAAGSDAHVAQGLGTARVRMRDFDGPEEFMESLRTAEIHTTPTNYVYVQALKFLQTRAGSGGGRNAKRSSAKAASRKG